MSEEKIIEAALFTAGSPLSLKQLSKVTGLNKEKVKEFITELKEIYERRNTSIEVKEVGNKYVMQVKTKFADNVRNLASRDISSPVLRTLSLIAFRQPIRQSEVVDIRGNKAYKHVSELEQKSLIDSEPQGRTKLLFTTPSFSEYFGLDVTKPNEVRKKLSQDHDTPTLENFFES